MWNMCQILSTCINASDIISGKSPNILIFFFSELTLAMKRLHETLIVLAARVQTLHTSVQSQKEQYKNLRRVYFKDDSNIFEQDADQTLTKKPNIYSLRSLTGPTPFSETPGGTANLNVDGLAMLAGSTVTSIVTTTSNPSKFHFRFCDSYTIW